MAPRPQYGSVTISSNNDMSHSRFLSTEFLATQSWRSCSILKASSLSIMDLQQGRAMPIQYRTPEMLLDMPWDYSVDLWALALTI
ncbi:hypothetical protein MCOR27_003766 [Pyricularia oryzae]|nr:hypothetical protein MCOR27_003766 [Pyricularia oryzae]KAI6603608.1 hypothetical protein MCOR12_002948 [Pyricularia oryzae]